MVNKLLLTTALLIPSFEGAHVHGEWSLFAALDGKRLEITLTGPMEDILGFEHKPETEKEHEALDGLKTTFPTLSPLISLNGSAGCVLDTPTLTLPEGFDHEDHDDDDHDDEDHDDHDDDDHDDHDDDDHDDDDHDDDDHDDDDHDHEDDDDHDHESSNIDITYQYTCSSPGALSQVTYVGFSAFPAIEKIEAVALTGKGQFAAELKAASAVLKLTN